MPHNDGLLWHGMFTIFNNSFYFMTDSHDNVFIMYILSEINYYYYNNCCMDSNIDSNRVTTITCLIVMIQFDMSNS